MSEISKVEFEKLFGSHYEPSEEVEKSRQEALAELTEGEEERVVCARFSRDTELMDHANMMVELWDKYVLNHPATILSKDAYERAYHITDILADFYQTAGMVCWPDNNDQLSVEVNDRGYGASIEFDTKENCFVGRCFIGTGMVEFRGTDVDGLKQSMGEAVTSHLNSLKEKGIDEYGEPLEDEEVKPV